jgi:hypothetical protein
MLEIKKAAPETNPEPLRTKPAGLPKEKNPAAPRCLLKNVAGNTVLSMDDQKSGRL